MSLGLLDVTYFFKIRIFFLVLSNSIIKPGSYTLNFQQSQNNNFYVTSVILTLELFLKHISSYFKV